MCPKQRPDFNSFCDLGLQGTKCEYGSQECCGETYPEVVMECQDSQWIGYYVDTLCIRGKYQILIW